MLAGIRQYFLLKFSVINFCPNKSIHSSVSVRLEETLIIDGSDAAIVSQDLPAGMTTCECAITYMYYGLELPESPVDKDSESNTSHTLGKGRQFDEEAPLPKLLVQSRTDNTSRCGKSVKVTQIEDNDLHWLRCSSRDVEFEEIPRYGTMKMTLSVELPKPADTLYQVELKAGNIISAKLPAGPSFTKLFLKFYEPRHEKTNILHVPKHRRRSASR